MPGLGPAPHSWEGSALGWGGALSSPQAPSSGQGRAALVHACRSPEVTSGLPSQLTSQLSLVRVQGGREEDPGLSSPKAAVVSESPPKLLSVDIPGPSPGF